MIPLDSQINLILQNFLGGGIFVTSVMNLFSFFGSVVFYTLLVSAIYWCFDTGLGLRLGIALFSACNIYNMFKLMFHLPRPYWVDARVKALAVEPSFGFPSGHAQMAASVWGLLGLSTRKVKWIIASTILILVIAISRLYLGVHFLSDVIGGLVLGVLLLAAIWLLDRPVRRWVEQTSPLIVFMVSAVIGLLFLTISYFSFASIMPWKMPVEWITDYSATINPATMKDIVESVGIWLGFIGGVCWLRSLSGKLGQFSTNGIRTQKIWRFLIGIAGILFLYGSIGLLVPHTESLFEMIIRFIRSGLVGFWITGLAPVVFIKTGLAQIKQA
jgi:membrane-associated phospholipid phosphatase